MSDEKEKERYRMRRRNYFAKEVRTPKYRQRRVPSGKEYKRENKGNLKHRLMEEDKGWDND